MPNGPESVPITIILGAEHDFAARYAVVPALVGATEKTSQNGQNLKKRKIQIFRHRRARGT